MKIFLVVALFVILGGATLFLFFRGIDSAMEVDNLKTHIQLQKKEMHFLQSIANSAFSFCKTSVSEFEAVVHANRRTVLWQGDEALVGPFRVKRNGTCIVSIEAIGL